jgi:hypothetical protein
LAVLAMAAGQLAVAEDAFAALGHFDKLRFVQHLRKLASGGTSAGGGSVRVAAELLLYAGQPEQAEAKLLQVRARVLNVGLTRDR